ncbi:MAG: ribosome recycling factor [Alphaproteobacteria bacterium]
MTVPDLKDLERRMKGAVDVLRREFGGLRTGRASTSLLDPVTVDAYGSKMPLNQVGSVSVMDARLLTVQVWDAGLVGAVEKAIREASLGLNPATEGNSVRVPIPELNEERRGELAKVARKYAEQTRVSVRNIRRDGMDKIKRGEKDGDMSKDAAHDLGQEIQKLTDGIVSEIDEAASTKEAEIMQV